MDRQIDAVVVAPNHIHVPASIAAMRQGEHLYCEKPLAHSVTEARRAAQVAQEVKMARDGHSDSCDRELSSHGELIRPRAIGDVRECHCWLRGGGGAGAAQRNTANPRRA